MHAPAPAPGCMPLEGVRVLDFGRYIAAPLCAAMLGDQGAEVIRVESVEGASDRDVMPVGMEGRGALYLQMNRNKKSLALDFERPEGREILNRLISASDVVVVNLPRKPLRRMRLDYDSLSDLNPLMVLCTITAFGYEGPDRDRVGFDGTGQALSGAMFLTGTGETPMRAACSYVDYSTGMAAAYAVVSALLARSRSGKGQHVQASLLGTALAIMNPMLIEEATGARRREPLGNRSPIAGPSDLFATRDGWILVQVIGDAMFGRWANMVGRPELTSDPRFVGDIARGDHGDLLSAMMSEWCASRTSSECLAALEAVRVPGCIVSSPRQALEARENSEGGFFRWQEVDDAPAVPIAAPMARLSASAGGSFRPAPHLGQDTCAILAGLGYGRAEILKFEHQGLIRRAGAEAPVRQPTTLS